MSERLTRFAYREVLEAGAAHLIMPDVIWTGGLTESAKIAALADTYHLSIAPHDCTGPVNVFACLHLCAAVPTPRSWKPSAGSLAAFTTSWLTARCRSGKVRRSSISAPAWAHRYEQNVTEGCHDSDLANAMKITKIDTISHRRR